MSWSPLTLSSHPLSSSALPTVALRARNVQDIARISLRGREGKGKGEGGEREGKRGEGKGRRRREEGRGEGGEGEGRRGR